METLFRKCFLAASVAAATACLSSCSHGQKIQIYPENGTSRIKALTTAEYVSTPDGLDVVSHTVTKPSGITFKGNWDLSGCNRLMLDVTNPDPCEYLHLTVQIDNPGCNLSSKTGVFYDTVYISPGETETVSIPLPPRFPHPEVAESFTGMRSTPYSVWGYGSVIDLTDINEIHVYVNKPRSDIKWTLSGLYGITGKPGKLKPWMEKDSSAFFPFIDRYGQFKHNDWPGKTHSNKDLAIAKAEEAKDIAAHPGADDRSRYGGWADGPRLESTGHFRVEKVDGKWWMVDPDGYLFWSHGVVRVTPSTGITPLDAREFYFEELPEKDSPLYQFFFTCDTLLKPYYEVRNIRHTYDFSSANIFRKYGENWRQEFADMAHKRLKSWGMNTIANSSDKSICLMDKTVYTDRIEIKSPYIEGSQSGLWWKFRDPYTEEFAESVRTQLEERRNELEDPWCLGFFVDNEIGWGEAHSIGEWTMLSPASQPAKKEMVRRLKEKYRDIARLNSAWTTSFKSWSDMASSQAGLPEAAKPDLCDFSKAVIRKYFSTTREIFKEIAPEKLYLGCRFARSNPDVLRIAAEYCDVLSYNIYKHDLSTFSLPEGIDKPVIIGEFHFGAKDRGPFHPGLINTYSQEQRGEAYERYVESALENAYIIGTHWHQFSDQATTGRFDGENFQVGMTDICDRPYYETIRHVRNIGYRMYAVRSGRDR